MRTNRRAHRPVISGVLALTLLGGCASAGDEGEAESPLAQVCDDLLAGDWSALDNPDLPSGEKEFGDAVYRVQGWMNDQNTGYAKLVTADYQAEVVLDSLDTAWERCETVEGFPELESPAHRVMSDEVEAHVRAFQYND